MILVSNVLFCCSGCSDSCDLITLGTYRYVDNYAVNGAENVVSGFFLQCVFFFLQEVGFINLISYLC